LPYQVMIPLSSSSSTLGSSETLPFKSGNLHRPSSSFRGVRDPYRIHAREEERVR
jgi:hypothetical protein